MIKVEKLMKIMQPIVDMTSLEKIKATSSIGTEPLKLLIPREGLHNGLALFHKDFRLVLMPGLLVMIVVFPIYSHLPVVLDA